MKNKKIMTLLLTFSLTLGGFSICKAAPNVSSNLDKPCNIYSIEVPNSISNFAKEKFQTILQSVRNEPETYGLSKEIVDDLYLGSGFNIFEESTNVPTNQNIYYFTVMYNNEIKAILTVGFDPKGGIYATLGTDFAKQLQQVFQKDNDGTSFILVSSDNNIYAQNKSGSYPIFIYQKDKTDKLEKVTYEKHLSDVSKVFKVNNKLDVKKKFDTVARNTNITYNSNILKTNSLVATSLSSSLKSTWLQVPIVNQRDSSGVQRGMCWAASVASILNYKNGYNLSATTICNLMRTGYDDGGSASMACTAMQYYGVNTARETGGIISDTSIESYINNNTPIYMHSWNANGNHATVIRGYMVGSGYIQISMMNPATENYQAAYPSGSSYLYSMGNATYVWTDTVVYN